MAGSPAFWLGSQASEFAITPSGEVGSVGVLSVHADHSKQLDKEGVAVTIVKSSPYKAEGSPFQPLTDSAKSYVQSRVDEIHRVFVNHLARGRRTSVKRVSEGFGRGRMVSARNAVAVGMADRVATLNQVVDELAIKSSLRPRISQQFPQGSWEIAESRARTGWMLNRC
jgi:ClpP class serine protease